MKLPIVIFFALCSADGILGVVGFDSTGQDWGLVEIRPGASLFWWLYYTTANVSSPLERPLIIWLEGGPGVSGTGYGNFYQIGPFDIYGNPREADWVADYNVLYIDHPVGTGFSHASNDSDLVTNNHEAVSDIFNCIEEFLLQLPEFQTVPTYIAGESYGGKVAPELAAYWHQAEQDAVINSTLKGVLLLSAWVSGIDSTSTWAEYLLGMARIDKNGYNLINDAVVPVQLAIDEGRWADATTYWWQVGQATYKATGDLDFNDVLSTKLSTSNVSSITRAEATVYMNGPVKEALGLNITWAMNKTRVYNAQADDFVTPVMTYVEYLLNQTDLNVVVCSGQLDVIINHLGTNRWIEKLSWSDVENWKNADHEPVWVNEVIEGYHKGFGNFSLYWVLRSGHTIASGNPAAMKVILQRLTNNAA